MPLTALCPSSKIHAWWLNTLLGVFHRGLNKHKTQWRFVGTRRASAASFPSPLSWTNYFRDEGMPGLWADRPPHLLLSHLPVAAKRVSLPVPAGVLASVVSPCPSPSSRLMVPGTLLWAHNSLPLSLLVDSGADDNFTDECLARQAHIPIESLPSPFWISTAKL